MINLLFYESPLPPLDDDEGTDQSAVPAGGEGGDLPGGAVQWANGRKPGEKEPEGG